MLVIFLLEEENKPPFFYAEKRKNSLFLQSSKLLILFLSPDIYLSYVGFAALWYLLATISNSLERSWHVEQIAKYISTTFKGRVMRNDDQSQMLICCFIS